MRLGVEAPGKSRAEAIDLGVRESDGLAGESDEMRDAGNLQYAQSFREGDAHEHIAREERQFEIDAAIFPPAHGRIQGQEVLDAAGLEFGGDAPLVVGASVRHEPMALGVEGRQSESVVRSCESG
jgi:hypothetical protein